MHREELRTWGSRGEGVDGGKGYCGADYDEGALAAGVATSLASPVDAASAGAEMDGSAKPNI